MRRSISLARLVPHYFINGTVCGNNIIDHKMCILIIYRNILANIINVYTSLFKNIDQYRGLVVRVSDY
jgi:hypothetical protein